MKKPNTIGFRPTPEIRVALAAKKAEGWNMSALINRALAAWFKLKLPTP